MQPRHQSRLTWFMCMLLLAGTTLANEMSSGSEGDTAPSMTAPTSLPSAGGKHLKQHWPLPALGSSNDDGPEVLFTFDDGPHENHTPAVLDALKKHGVQAIFFVTGWRLTGNSKDALRRRSLFRRELDEGQIIGNHTYHHAHMCTVKRPKGEWEIDENARLLRELSGMDVAFFRTPYGSRCKQVEQLLAARSLNHLHWDIDGAEYVHRDAERVKRYLIRKIGRLHGRGVVLMHDTQPVTAKVLPEVLDWIEAENARRHVTGQATIRILSYADVARERIPTGVLDAVHRLATAMQGAWPVFESKLLTPLIGKN